MILLEFCSKKNINQLQLFLEKNWKKNYILSKEKKLLNWQHYSKINKRYNFIIAKKKSKIVGCLGFIRNSNFSKNLTSNDTIWLVNWVMQKDNSAFGLNMIYFLIKNFKFNKIGTLGCNDRAAEIYRALDFTVGNLNHYFLINNEIKNLNLVKVPKIISDSNKVTKKNKFRILLLEKGRLNFDCFGNNLKKLSYKFGKDKSYFINRYVLHPYYKYQIYWILSSKNIKLAFFVIRVCIYKKSKAIRIVDFFGHERALNKISLSLKKLLQKYSAEFIDFYASNLNKKIMLKSGLLKNSYKNKIIIPNYFEPFSKKNIKLVWAIKQKSLVGPIFKGDCDQDRPNRII